MAWWDTIAKVGGIAAAPFTGGMSLWPALALGGGAAAGGYLAGRGGKGGDDGNPEDALTKQLQGQSDQLNQQGQQFSSMGADAIAPGMQYLQQLLSNNPAAFGDATRQERGRVLDQYDTARRAIANFGPRGGGTTSALAESQFAQAESLADIGSNLRRDAAVDLSQIGMNLSGLGLSAEQLQSSNLEAIINAVLSREGLDTQRRGQNMAMVGDIAETAGTLFGIYLGRDQKKAA